MNFYKNKNSLLIINSLVFIISLASIIIFWLTDIYNDLLLQNIVLKNDSDILNWYLKPPINPIIKVYIFNYTNVEAFYNGTESKLKLQECGPYVYQESIERANIHYEEDQITYHENRSHFFMPDETFPLTETDFIIAPNIPLVSAIPIVKDMGFFAEIGFKGILRVSNPQDFHKINVKKFLFGYRDDFMDLLSKFKWGFIPEDVGVLAPRRGLTKKSKTVNRGTKDSEDIGRMIMWGDKASESIWNSEKCNDITGYDAVFYGPKKVRSFQDVFGFLPEMCRTLPLEFQGETETAQGITSYFYGAPFGTFTKGTKNYCELKSLKNKTHVNGVIKVSDCVEDTPPVFISYPHFMEGDEKLFEIFEGLLPNRSIHRTFLLLHPRFSTPVEGTSRLQVNLQVSHFNSHYEKIPEDSILPVAWVETTISEIPPNFKFLFFLSTTVVDWFEIFMKYASIIGLMCSLLLYYVIFKARMINFTVVSQKEEI